MTLVFQIFQGPSIATSHRPAGVGQKVVTSHQIRKARQVGIA